MYGLQARVVNATEWEDVGTLPYKFTNVLKALRVDGEGTLEWTSESGNSTGTWNVLQGEILNIYGKPTITGGTAVVIGLY